uniref:Uncharacterized protein n=1 Tax=Romanomermis culicivorax TaxID=13658 RepID=A0A915JPZ7_ROMCU
MARETLPITMHEKCEEGRGPKRQIIIAVFLTSMFQTVAKRLAKRAAEKVLFVKVNLLKYSCQY